jgi:hypothetical protein
MSTAPAATEARVPWTWARLGPKRTNKIATVSRALVLEFFSTLPSYLVGLEGCASAHLEP